MNTEIVKNPYYCYIISFGLALFIYSWGWSELYPALTVQVSGFLLCSFIIAFYVGKVVDKKLKYREANVDEKNQTIVLCLLLGYVLEILYNKGIPLILLLRGEDISYMEFGIPTFHVILHTFSSFYTVYIFHQYLSDKSKKLLFFVFALLTPHVLIVNRGALIMTIVACLILYLLSIRKIAMNRVFVIVIISLVFFFGFGYLGNGRSFNGDSAAFPRITRATDDFLESKIPNEYYWFYIYASSPFANFQNATISNINHRYDVPTFITWELLPDFISKRIVPIESDYDGIHRTDYSINPILTVGSIYFEPFIRMNWYGPILVFFFFIVAVFSYIRVFPNKSKYMSSAIAILCVVSIFNIFENMLNFSGLIFQLVYPLLLSVLEMNKVKFTGFRFKRVKFVMFSRKV